MRIGSLTSASHTARNGLDRVIPDRVITLDSLDGRLEGVRQISVVPGAVITPAAKDELQRRSIEFVYDGQDRAPRPSPSLVLLSVWRSR